MRLRIGLILGIVVAAAVLLAVVPGETGIQRGDATRVQTVAGGVVRDVTSVTVGGMTGCAIRAPGTLWCWGANGFGQVGTGNKKQASRPARIGAKRDWVVASSGGLSTCAVRAKGAGWCWGLNNYGQLGDGTRESRLAPTKVASNRWRTISTGPYHTCGISRQRKLYCWGRNDWGQLGDGTTSSRSRPTRVAGGGKYKEVAAGGWHTCAIRRNGNVYCFGRGVFGALGDGTSLARRTPVRAVGLTRARSITTSWAHSCAVRNPSKKVYCWGRNDHGEIGDGTTAHRVRPTKIKNRGRDFVKVSADDAFTCAKNASDKLFCWGSGKFGRFGDGTGGASLVPKRGPGSTWRGLDVGWFSGCAVRQDRALLCWGGNESAQLGDGTRTLRPRAGYVVF